MKIIRYFLEFILVIFFFLVFKIIGLKLSSDLGEIIGKYFGPLFRKKTIAKKNILIAFPNFNEKSINEMIDHMWKNIGRIFGEYIHINKFSIIDNNKKKIVFTNRNNVEILKKNNKPIVFFSGHFANFELMAKCLQELGFDIGAIYRPLNNIFLNPIMEFIRKKYICPIQIEKGSNGTKKLIKHISNNNPLALMVDQRLSSSIRVPFFDQPATTTITPAQLAIKYDALLVPVFLKRLEKTNFEFFIEEPLITNRTNDYDKDIFNITQIMNIKIEEFIKRDPAHWLWSHDRWK
ncbi:MAG: lysophospholipid acyltransferase family protein [Candidatus Fonsibacter sp.]|nr:lysophospholipid acyltransferase family protein [Candidatus Fonsibacter sp.]